MKSTGKELDVEKNSTKASKVMVLAVQRLEGKVVITPIDNEHDEDNLTADEETARKAIQNAFISQQPAMVQALGNLYDLFTHQLHRGSFRTFENCCFALFGMNRISEEKKTKARDKARKLTVVDNQNEEVVV